jgi:hypothetical protein
MHHSYKFSPKVKMVTWSIMEPGRDIGPFVKIHGFKPHKFGTFILSDNTIISNNFGKII